MESNASSSTTSGGGRRPRVRTPGIPRRCWCRENISEKLSRSTSNLYCRYYRCLYAAQRKLENANHIFKWVDEDFSDEIQQLDYQVRGLEEEVQMLKATIRNEGPRTMPKKMILGGCLVILSVVVVGIWVMYKNNA